VQGKGQAITLKEGEVELLVGGIYEKL